MARKTLLTAELTEKICEFIRQGAFDYVAAQAVGINPASFYGWLKDGQEENADPLKVEFFKKVSEARGAARREAEAKVFAEQPFNWLRYGPGRERPGEPGWTDERKLTVDSGGQPIKLIWGNDSEATND